MDLAQSTEDITRTDDLRWWGSAHATQNFPPITLDGGEFLTLFGPDTDYEGWVPSGVYLAKRASDGLHVPYDDASIVGGVAVCVGLLAHTVKAVADRNVGAALYDHGPVNENLLPADAGDDAAAKVDLAGRIWFRTV